MTSINTNVSFSSAATFLKIYFKDIKNKIKTLLEIGKKEDIPLSFFKHEIFTSKHLGMNTKPIFDIKNINFHDYILITIIMIILLMSVLLPVVFIQIKKLEKKIKKT